MGVLEESVSLSVHVHVEFRSGVTMDFEVPEDIFRYLEELRQNGLVGAELCKTWLGSPLRSDPPELMRVSGNQTDGTLIDVVIRCDREAHAAVDKRHRAGARRPSE